MSEEQFDAIVVGGGPAGASAALVLAREGGNVLVIERGNYAGAKNVTGGRLYGHSLERLIPGFSAQAPIERRITREKISFLTDDRAVTLDYHNGRNVSLSHDSYSILRAKFDPWLMAQAEKAGAQFIPGIRVDGLVQHDGRVVGVEADGEVLEANTVILAEGVNAILAEKIGMAQSVSPESVAIGVKELIELPRELLEARFGLEGCEGTAWLFAGSPSGGQMGGGFLYTNRDTLSLGFVYGLHHIEHAKKSVPQMLEDFKRHPAVRPLIANGKTIEYAAHLVPEAGINMQPKLVGDGVLIIGDTAGMCLNLGFTVRGMDLAIASGEAAARAVLEAKEKNDFTSCGLNGYLRHLEELSVMKALRHYRNVPAMMDNPRLFTCYPQMAADIMADLFTVDGQPPQPLRKKIMRRCKAAGYLNLIKDGIKGITTL